MIKFALVITEGHHCSLLPTTYKMLPSISSQGYLHTGDMNVDFDIIDQLLNIASVFKCRRKKCDYNGTVYQLFIDFMKAYDPVGREVSYIFPIKLGIPMKLIRLIKICLNKAYSEVRIGKPLSDEFLVQNRPNQSFFIIIAFQLSFRICH